MTTMTETEAKEKYADKIAKLLNQAENPAATEAEAASFMAMAAKWMELYAIDEQMLDALRGLSVDELVQDQFDYTGIYRNAHQELGAVVAQHFGLKIVYGRDSYRKPIVKPLYLTGFRSDVERARLLDTSLQLQCAHAHDQWWKANKDDFYWMDKGTAFRTRRDFVFGFVSGVAQKLTEAKREARAEAVAHEAERTGADATEAKASVALVLVNRKTRVDEYYETVWGGRTRNASRRYGAGADGGHDAGRAAGRNANTNTGASLRGSRGAIGR